MCGFAGFAGTPGTQPDLQALAARMAGTLAHRGPDGQGVWADAHAGVGLGHRRLAVLDLSPAGAQPQVSACGRYVLAFNGEVYNFRTLRAELAGTGARFAGSGDTEVLLAACARWGASEAARRARGMFAFALWDRHTRTLTLARDALGIKPLYWAVFGGALLFGSELKALAGHPAWRGEIDADALRAYACRRYVPGPLSIYRDVFKLPPGTLLTWQAGAAPRLERFWTLPAGGTTDLPPAQALADVETALREAVAGCMAADVAVGALLSGGTDSAAVTALMREVASGPVRTFTVAFADPRYNEAPIAREFARHLGTDHTEITADPDALLRLVPQLPHCYDEPFADSSQLPTLLLAQAVGAQVKVALSGDGGDEVFGGYDHYFDTGAYQGWLRVPGAGFLANAAGALARAPLPAPARRRVGKWAQAAHIATSPDVPTLYRRLTDKGPGTDVLAAPWRHGAQPAVSTAPVETTLAARLGRWDIEGPLPDRMLVKVDRASMAAGLEVRVPLLDTGLLECVWRLPPALRYAAGDRKPLLRSLARRYLPAALLDQPKRGFSVPLRSWLRGPLRDFAQDLLDPRALAAGGYFDAGRVGALWKAHQRGHADVHHALWTVLMFELWRRQAPAATLPPTG